jgi:hypothetical protein
MLGTDVQCGRGNPQVVAEDRLCPPLPRSVDARRAALRSS